MSFKPGETVYYQPPNYYASNTPFRYVVTDEHFPPLVMLRDWWQPAGTKAAIAMSPCALGRTPQEAVAIAAKLSFALDDQFAKAIGGWRGFMLRFVIAVAKKLTGV